MSKTKAQLELEIKELKEQLNTQSKVEQYDQMAQDLRNIFDSLVRVGFTEEQAWSILAINMGNANKPKVTLF